MSQLEKKDMPLVFQFVSKDVENNRKKSINKTETEF